MHRLWLYWRIIHITIDLLMVYGAFLLAYFTRVGFLFSSDFPFPLFALLSAGAAVMWIGFLIFTKYYRIPPRDGERALFDISLSVVGGIVAVGILIVTYFFPRDMIFSRLIGVYALIFGSLWLIFSHEIFNALLAYRKKQHKDIYRTLIIGANRVAEKIIDAINKNPYAPYKIIGVIDPYGIHKKVQGSTILGKLNTLEEICDREKITALIQCDAFEHTINMISLCEEKNIKFQFDPALRGIFEENLRIREVAGITMISFVKRDYEGFKRTKFKLIDWILHQMFDID